MTRIRRCKCRSSIESSRINSPRRASHARGSWTLRLVALLLLSLPLFGAAGPAHLVATSIPGKPRSDPAALRGCGSYTRSTAVIFFQLPCRSVDPGVGHTSAPLETDGAGVERLAEYLRWSRLCSTRVLPAPGAGDHRLGGLLHRPHRPPSGGPTATPRRHLPARRRASWRRRTMARARPTPSSAPTANPFYAAWTPEEGCEPWASDGTAPGPRQIPLAPGRRAPIPRFKDRRRPGSSSPRHALGERRHGGGDAGSCSRRAGHLQEDFLPLGNALSFISTPAAWTRSPARPAQRNRRRISGPSPPLAST